MLDRDKELLRTIIVLLLSYLLGAVLLYIFQRNILYIASPEYAHEYDVINLVNDQEVLKIAVLNPNQSRAIIYFGGNAEAVIFNEMPFLENFPEHTLYLANYRGYGGSTGTPTELGLFSDALALYDRIRDQHDSVATLGRSLGSGVATYLASNRAISHLALVTPYDSIVNVARARFPIYPISFLMHDKYNSIGTASKVSTPVLIIMAEHDSIIPNAHSIKLGDAFSKTQLTSLKIDGADHNNVSVSAGYFSALVEFFNRVE